MFLLWQPGDRSALAGVPNVPLASRPPPYLDIPHQPVSSVKAAIRALESATEVCRLLMEQKKIDRARAVLEDVALRVLPKPHSAGAGKHEGAGATASWWHEIVGAGREAVLRALNAAATMYLGASVSTATDDPDPLMTKSRRYATMLSLLSCFDAAIRCVNDEHHSSGGGGQGGYAPLAGVLSEGFVLDIYPETCDGAERQDWHTSNKTLRSVLANDPHVARSLCDSVAYFRKQRAHVKSKAGVTWTLFGFRYEKSSKVEKMTAFSYLP